MTLEELKEKYIEIIHKQNNIKGRVLDDFGEPTELFVEMYESYPDCYYYQENIDNEATINNIAKTFECFWPDTRTEYIKDNSEFTIKKTNLGKYCVTVDGFIKIYSSGIFIYTNNEEFRDKIFNCIVPIVEEYPCEVYWVTQGSNGFGINKLTLKDGLFNIKSHYNDDFNYTKVNEFIRSKDSGLIIFHGTPGTGKTFVLRNLAQENPDIHFYFMDKSTFNYIDNQSLIQFLFSEQIKNSIFVLEDCETLLTDRINTGNHLLSTILNLSDGILGDGLNIKFICTFNADLVKIDKAILRKGRLKYKYEFKALTPEKTQMLAKELNKNIPSDKSLTVAEIYNWEEDNNNKAPKRKPIGFG